MVTIKDVAREAKVGVATVSYAINGTAPLKDETKKRIFQAIERLGYHPNTLARSLATKKTNIIGLSIPFEIRKSFTRHILPDMLNGITDGLGESCYDIVFLMDSKDRSYMSRYKSGLLDGLLITGPTVYGEQSYHELKEQKFPFVVVGNVVGDALVSTVDIDNVKVAFDATKHLINAGRQELALLCYYPKDQIYILDRIEGFRRAVKAAGQSPVVEQFVGNTPQNSLEQGIQNILTKAPHIDGVFTMDPVLAARFINAALEQGIRVPQDISVISCDDIELTELCSVGITTMRIPYYEIGFQATKLLLQTIENPDMKPQRVWVEPELLKRDSC